MAQYDKLIPENTATTAARRIGIYNRKGNRVGFIPLGNLKLPGGLKQYSFGALADIHLQYDTGMEDFQRAMAYLNGTGQVSFTCIAGDLVVNGTETELQQYKAAVEQYSPDTPVYAAAGNHEYYAEKSREYFIENVGNPLYYSFRHGNDIFIMAGVIGGNEGSLFADGELQWLYETLEENRNKRCFLFQHIPPEEGCGDILNLYPYTKLRSEKESLCFKSLLRHYKNVVFFHGHTHTKFHFQEYGNPANYDRLFGCHSVHIPSLAVPRDDHSYDYAGSEGYVVDVYETGIHLRGRDFVKEEFLPIASYWLDTAVREVEAGTYVDETGTIVVNSTSRLGDAILGSMILGA